MNTGSSKSPESRVWRDLYKAALFEHDERKFPERIADAERALVQRARELFHNSGDKHRGRARFGRCHVCLTRPQEHI